MGRATPLIEATPRTRLLLTLAAPLAALAVAGVGEWVLRADDDSGLLARQSTDVQARFTQLLDSAGGIADDVLSGTSGAPLVRGPLAARLEGYGIVDPDGALRAWSGTPSDPPEEFLAPDWPRFSIRVDGVRTRLLVRAGPDEAGRHALTTFLIDSTLADRAFEALLPRGHREAVHMDVSFRDTEVDRAFGKPDTSQPPAAPPATPDAATYWLESPEGDALAFASVVPLDTEQRIEELRRAGRAWAVVSLALAFGLCLPWRRLTETRAGFAAATFAVVALRMLFDWQEVALRLFPRELGTASVFGSPRFSGLLASPADLLFTSGALWALCRIAGRRLSRPDRGRRHGAALLVLLFAAAATGAVAEIVLSLTRNSRIPLLERPAPFVDDARAVLWLSVILGLLGAAEIWARLPAVWRSREGERADASRVSVGLAFVLLSFATAFWIRPLAERLALEQLSSELAPQVLAQRDRRAVTLLAAIGQVADRLRNHEPGRAPLSWRPEALAYHYWSTGELFHSGFRSSLAFYTPGGDEISSFGFGLPPITPHLLDPATEDPERLVVFWETIPDLGGEQNLLHVQVDVLRAGESRGTVVGHMLDEPDNLPFLPWTQPYLAALGPGSPRAGREFPGDLHYIVYDPAGAVRLSTLAQPPTSARVLATADDDTGRVRLHAADDRYSGLALHDERDRLHVLLVPAPGALAGIALAIRMCLLGLAILAGLAVGQRLRSRSARRDLVSWVRESYYRKLLLTLLVASGVPLIVLAVFLRGYIEARANESLMASATQFVSAAQRVVEDYASLQADPDAGESLTLTDSILYWLRGVVGQEIHVYEDGILRASSRPELFDSGLLSPRLDGRVHERLVDGNLPTLVVQTMIGPSAIPVAYTPVRAGPGEPDRVVAVPLVLQQRQIRRATARVSEMILIATVALVGLLAITALILASTVARPVRELVRATGRIAAGDYSARLEPRTRDELAELVHGFNAMGSALEQQRSDLRRQRDDMETLLRHDTTGVLALDPAGRIVTLNPAAATFLGLADGAAAIGSELESLLSTDPALRPLADALARAHRDGEPSEVDLHRGESRRRFHLMAVALKESERETRSGSLILLDDVTDLMRSNQLAAWAEMAQVIAHEIKNPLTPIQLSAEHLERVLADRGVLPDATLAPCLQTITRQVRTLHQIAGEFATYAKLPALQLRAADPVEAVRDGLAPYRSALPEGVRLEERYLPCPAVELDGRVFERALVNLVENAIQAMVEGGTLTVSVTPDAGGAEVVVSVEDTGPGLDPGVRDRLFEPYFSTKATGTGLGLAIVRRSVEGHGGRITVASEPGRGTRFRIHLPGVPGRGL